MSSPVIVKAQHNNRGPKKCVNTKNGGPVETTAKRQHSFGYKSHPTSRSLNITLEDNLTQRLVLSPRPSPLLTHKYRIEFYRGPVPQCCALQIENRQN